MLFLLSDLPEKINSHEQPNMINFTSYTSCIRINLTFKIISQSAQSVIFQRKLTNCNILQQFKKHLYTSIIREK